MHVSREPVRFMSQLRTAAFAVALAAAVVLAVIAFFPHQPQVQEGDVASRDLTSPRDVAFESELLTERSREEAAAAVPDVLSFDPTVRAQQTSRLDTAVARATQVRDDRVLDQSAKKEALGRIQNLGGLSQRSLDTILSLPAERWQVVINEAREALSATMDESIGPDAVGAAKDALGQKISPALTGDEALLSTELVRPLVVPTLVVDQQATDAARETARNEVVPERITVSEGQHIVAGGEKIDATIVEVLREVGLLSPRVEWDNMVAVIMVALAASAGLAAYLFLFRPAGVSTDRHLLLLVLVVAVPVLLAKLHLSLILPDEERLFLAYILPLAAAPMLVATLLEGRLAVVVVGLQALLLTFVVVYLPDVSLAATVEPLDALRVLTVYLFGGVAGVYAIYRAERLNRYLFAGLGVAAVSLAALLIGWFLDQDRQGLDVAWMTTWATVNGVSSGLLAAGASLTLGGVFGVVTRVQLMELSQLNSPLLRRLQDDAPGTFHHSIIVGNLGERAAYLVGADPLLVRVGCYYHDIGKILQPGFYAENQMGGDNPHDGMDPGASARAIAQHVRAGLELARRYRLPSHVQAFIPEHHGTLLVTYFYRKATQEGEGEVDPAAFSYPGPRPQSRETGIVMLADSVEAVVRSSADRSPERIDQLVEEVIAERIAQGQLDDCDLTLRDIRTIAESFKTTLRGVYHPRIEYPEPTEAERRRPVRWPLFPRPAAPP
ncbi:MAG: HDIG domain-containing metalloprotein, partial [Dehalococcoidia bacterium]